MIKEKIINKFGKDILHNSCIWYKEGEKNLRSLLERLKLDNVLEIGTAYGLSGAIISEYCNHVYTYDIHDFKQKYEVWEFLGLKNIGFDRKLNLDRKYDLAFIDGWHWNGQCEKDFKKCKDIHLILFHDYNYVHKEVMLFIDTLKGNKVIKGNFVLYENKQ